jgi:signal transduction histidine kinase
VALAERAGRVLTRDQIMEAVRGRELEAFDRSIDVHMGRIRAAIEADVKNPKRILTVRGVGYVFRQAAGLTVAVGTYPIVRRLTKRLEHLRGGVERWGEGDLGARVNEDGNDEIAFLAKRFNQAAERVQTLVQTHKSLLANASHELRSPLARIRMGLELMGMGTQPSPAFREEISRNIAELDQLIDEILLASRLDARESDMGTCRGRGPDRSGRRGMRAP